MKDIKELFVPSALAQRLKDKGFDEECFAIYQENGRLVFTELGHPKNSDQAYLTAPTYQQAEIWLWDNYAMLIYPYRIPDTDKLVWVVAHIDRKARRNHDFKDTRSEIIDKALSLMI